MLERPGGGRKLHRIHVRVLLQFLYWIYLRNQPVGHPVRPGLGRVGGLVLRLGRGAEGGRDLLPPGTDGKRVVGGDLGLEGGRRRVGPEALIVLSELDGVSDPVPTPPPKVFYKSG